MSCNPDNIIDIKEGSSGTFVMLVTDQEEDADGNEIDVPKDLNGYEIFIDFVSQISNEMLFSANLKNGISLTEKVGQYVVDVGLTTDWPIGLMPLDILYVYKGIRRHTDDWALNISKGRSKSTIHND